MILFFFFLSLVFKIRFCLCGVQEGERIVLFI